MSNHLKQVYASLFIDENELQILVGEYYNTRFNIIRIDKVKMEGIIDYKITDYDRVVEIINKACAYTSSKIRATIKKAVLVVPSVNFVRYPLRVSVIPNGGIIQKKDIANALSSALRTKVDGNVTVVNASIIKYVVNGISSRRMPEKEICDELFVDIDLLCADKDMVYSYVKAVSDAGIEVLDITLNNYAICKEASIFEEALNQNIVLLDIGNEHSYLSLLSKGKLVSSELIRDGLSKMINHVHDTLKIPELNVPRLLKYNVDYETKNDNDAVFAWGDDNKNYSITVKELNESVKDLLNEYVEKILVMCKPIIDSNKTVFYVIGEGAKMDALVNVLRTSSNCIVKSYYPDTIGVRDSSLCAVFGSLFVYREKALMNDLNVACLDLAEYDATVDLNKVDVEGESITTKIKKMFEQYRDSKEEMK